MVEFYKSDKFKNNVICPDEEQYSDVHPIDYNLELGLLVDFICYDFPYATVNGGHNASNCILENSRSRIEFNKRYGIEMRYTPMNIREFFIFATEVCNILLKDGGFLLLKCKDVRHQPYVFEAIRLCELSGRLKFRKRFVYVPKSQGNSNVASNFSELIVFEKVKPTTKKNVEPLLTRETILDKSRKDYQKLYKDKGDQAQKMAGTSGNTLFLLC